MNTDSLQSVRFESILERFEQRDRTHYMAVPDEVAQQFTRPKPVRIMCLLNDSIEFHCALRPKGDGSFFISIGTPIRQQGKLQLGDRLQVVIWKDDSQYGRKMPEELTELLAIDEEGNRLFHALTPNQQRGIIYYVDGAKTPQVRIDRAIMMIDRLKINPSPA
ncbi:bacteriocin resistance YdeI/OmpD-like protein [Larkinella arboricola]|uniref:Bacteriocin resistance YdeI/OmpD-like protein n=1 Tax=Larkinella arboricola TaxID=643671 RepID=A0A327WQ37_LARAB|nr:YdeI/OmpD-associated family protein [Larkinella arboricola]RAJ94478.1 bacteriocin resistance YdeI/OmpD-like protein [Larkinella arboricola]